MFHRTVRPTWTGPFLHAGYHGYKIEPQLLDFAGHDFTPDLVAASSRHWVLLELTLDRASKAGDLENYARINPANLRNHGLPSDRAGPIMLVVRPSDADDGGHPQILVGRDLIVRQAERIADASLREALAAAQGTNLERLPEIPIAFVPESRAFEIRRGLVPAIMQLFGPESTPVTPTALVDQGLERLAEAVPVNRKLGLINIVKREMGALINGKGETLGDLLEFSDGSYRAKGAVPVHQKTMERISRVLKDWSGAVRSLDEFTTD